MQSEVPALPVVYSEGKKCSARNTDLNDESTSVQVKNHNTCKFSLNLVSNRKKLHPLVGGPYRTSMRLYALTEPIRSTNRTSVGQRVMSAKMLRVKQLQNQLSDAHYHLNELANENRLLKALQKRQDSALRKYEGKNAELPRIINSHHEELKVLQTKHKKLRAQHKQTCDLLKEKENEIHSLQAQNKHLVQLSKDRNLEEREKLQMRVSDLNFRIEQQQATIQTLNRKLALESKSLKQQLNAEVAKHKETQKSLHRTLEKLKNLEDFLDNREKRLYSSGRLPACNKRKTVGSQSLMNLGQSPPTGKSRGLQNDLENGSLPKLIRAESSDGKTIQNLKGDQSEEAGITETMSSLHKVRKFRLQKDFNRSGSGDLLNLTDKSDDEEAAGTESGCTARYSSIDKLRTGRTIVNDPELEAKEIKEFVDNLEIINNKEVYTLPKELMREFGYPGSESESDTEDRKDNEDDEKLRSDSLASKSRDLHTRLIADETILSRHSVPSKAAGYKYFTSPSDSESDSENRTKYRPDSIDDLKMEQNAKSSTLDGPQNRRNDVELSTADFLKPDIDGTSSAREGLDGATSELYGKLSNLAPNGLPNEVYEDDHQKRLLDMTKSWTEVHTRIKKDREISENQLKALNEELLTDKFLLERQVNIIDDSPDSLAEDRPLPASAKTSERSEQACQDFGGESFRSSKNKRESILDEEIVEISHPRQNGLAEDSSTDENAGSYKTIINDRESRLTTENTNDSVRITKDSNDRGSVKITANGIGKSNAGATDAKLIDFNKQRLLAAMKAIDDNDNIDFTGNHKYRFHNNAVRAQTTATENLYRGLPAHARKKDDLLKEIFGDGKVESKLRGGCSKLH